MKTTKKSISDIKNQDIKNLIYKNIMTCGNPNMLAALHASWVNHSDQKSSYPDFGKRVPLNINSL